MIRHEVIQSEENKSVERILLDNYNVNRNDIFKALRKKDIKINGARVKSNVLLKAGDIIEAYILIKQEVDTRNWYTVAFENEYVLIVNKKQGIPVISESKDEVSLINIINEDFKAEYQLCHRIDRNTGGLVIISKKISYTDIIKKAVNDRYFNKIYNCIVWGNAENLVGTHKAWLFKDSEKNKVYIYKEKKKFTKEIITVIKKADYNIANNTTALEIDLITGRTHQIRAHLAFLGHFIIGDGKYGINEINRKFDLKYQALWASCLEPNSNVSSFKEYNGVLPNRIITIEPSFE